MKSATTALQMLVRVTGLLQIIGGVLIWTGMGGTLRSLHIYVGLAMVLGLWALAIMGIRAGVSLGLVAGAIVWGLITAAFGMVQGRILPGSAHWVIQALHLVVGLGAMGLSEMIASRIKRSQTVAVLR